MQSTCKVYEKYVGIIVGIYEAHVKSVQSVSTSSKALHALLICLVASVLRPAYTSLLWVTLGDPDAGASLHQSSNKFQFQQDPTSLSDGASPEALSPGSLTFHSNAYSHGYALSSSIDDPGDEEQWPQRMPWWTMESQGGVAMFVTWAYLGQP